MSRTIYTIKDLENIPIHITKLYFTEGFNESINNIIPDWIEEIEFDVDSIFNCVCDILPHNLKKIKFGKHKDHTIEEISNFPKNLTHLYLGWEFNKKLKPNILPKNLLYLYIGYKYNQDIENNVLPEKLTHLNLNGKFNCEIKTGVLPKKLIYLRLGEYYNYKIKKNTLPESIHIIEILWSNMFINTIFKNLDKKFIIIDMSGALIKIHNSEYSSYLNEFKFWI